MDREEQLKKIKNERARQQAREAREKKIQVELQKRTVEYQKKVNVNREAFGLKKNPIQNSINNYFKTQSSNGGKHVATEQQEKLPLE